MHIYLFNVCSEFNANFDFQLRFATTEAPDKITKAVKAADEALKKKEKMIKECDQLKLEVLKMLFLKIVL